MEEIMEEIKILEHGIGMVINKTKKTTKHHKQISKKKTVSSKYSLKDIN